MESFLRNRGRTHRAGTLVILAMWPLAAMGAGPDGIAKEKARATAKPATSAG